MTLLRIFTILYFVLVSFTTYAQNNSLIASPIDDNDNWLRIESTQLSTKEFIQQYPELFDLDEASSLSIFQVQSDDQGMVHYRMRHEVNNIPVHASELIVHEKNGKLHTANGRLVYGDFAKMTASISADQAIQKALDHLNADVYLWQKPGMEALVKRIEKDVTASLYPQPELIYADEEYSQLAENYSLAWRMEIYAEEPVGTKEVFVDAQSGEVMYTLEKCHNNSVPGQAETRYHGLQEFTTDSVASNEYRLRDYTRASGIETYDAKNEFDVSLAEDFYDEDNFWDNANERFNDAAGDVHWGSGVTYDYFMNELGWNSYDNEGSLIISYVHVGSRWFNASWNGMFARYGDGNDNPLTGIDVVSHELTHGVTGNSSRLIYRNESGALNESFSDIFGNTVERYALGDSADWLIGRENYILRDMSNPKAFGDPDTYRGENWFTSAEDNGGVHVNSGVMNHWFYLMAGGGAGTNDNGVDYVVDGIGFYEAAKIAHRNNVFYLVPSSNYEDARIGALLSAEDIYGSCSEEVEQVAIAWNAVGVGPANVTQNLRLLDIVSPISSCAGENANKMEVRFEYSRSGCDFQLAAEDSINIGYRLRDGETYNESFAIGPGFTEGDQRIFSFDLPAPLIDPGTYKLDVWVAFKNGAGLNDTLFNHQVKIPEIIADEAVITFEPFSGSVDSFYVAHGDRADVIFPNSLDASEGFTFARLTGSEITGLEDLDFPLSSAELFERNESYGSQICFCAHLPDWEEGATLEFDMKQTWSSIYTLYGYDESSRLVGMRVTANDQLLAGPFHPKEHVDAKWERIKVDLSTYVNTNFTFCFEGRHFIEEDEDPMDNSRGDKTDIDKLSIIKGFSTSTNELTIYEFALYPNPNVGSFTVTVPKGLELNSLRVIDATGRVLHNQSMKSASRATVWQMNTSLPQGVYLLEIEGENAILRERFVVSR